jgi:uncharacterized protein YuzE
MKLTYDPAHNIAYIAFRDKPEEVETVKISDELNIDMAPDGTVYGIELLNANEQLAGAGGGGGPNHDRHQRSLGNLDRGETLRLNRREVRSHHLLVRRKSHRRLPRPVVDDTPRRLIPHRRTIRRSQS